jgi:hypothetical protein
MPKQTLYQIGGNRENHEFCLPGRMPATLNCQAGPGAAWTNGKRQLESDDWKAMTGKQQLA